MDLKGLFKLSPNMDSLIAIGSSASLLYGIFAIVMIFIGINTGNDELITNYKHELYFESAGMILALVSFGKFIENKAKGKTTKAISQLLDLAPKKAHLLKDNEVIDISVDDIKVGDKLIVKPGEQIPIDGVVIEGISEVDEASLTGESNPVLVEKDSNVKGGTTNLNGNFQMMATCESFDSTLQKIIDLVEVASNSKAPMAKLADKISLVFVPIVMSIALLVFIIWILITKNFEFSLARAISVLVISCPCALGLATPVAIMAGTYKAVKCGFLIKSGESLEKMCHVDTIVFDKTGTLTKGKPVVTDVITLNELLAIANAIESGSEHPLSKSICEYAKKNNVQLVKVTNFENLPGMGVKATYNDKTYYCANHKLLKHSVDQNIVTKLQNEGKTITYIFDDEKVYGIIAIRDEIKEQGLIYEQEKYIHNFIYSNEVGEYFTSDITEGKNETLLFCDGKLFPGFDKKEYFLWQGKDKYINMKVNTDTLSKGEHVMFVVTVECIDDYITAGKSLNRKVYINEEK